MKMAFRTVTLAVTACAIGNSQSPDVPKLEFEAVAIRAAAAPQLGHFRAPAASTGGPGTTDPGLYRCGNCTLAFLLTKAFDLRRYQFPGQSSLPDTAFDINATVPAGATPEQFLRMLQNLLKDRFGLAYHYDTKPITGYELVIAKGGPKLQESTAAIETKPAESAPNWHAAGAASGGSHTHNGLVAFHGKGQFRGEQQTMADLAQLISNQLAKPVDDHTGLSGRYDIALSWADETSTDAPHPPGAGDSWNHGSANPQSSAFNGPTLFGAVQSQLGLKLEPTKATAKILIVDHIAKEPTAN